MKNYFLDKIKEREKKEEKKYVPVAQFEFQPSDLQGTIPIPDVPPFPEIKVFLPDNFGFPSISFIQPPPTFHAI